MTEKKYLVALSSFLPFGPARLKLLIDYFGGAKDAWRVSKGDLLETGLKKNTVEKFIQHRKEFNFKKFFREVKDRDIKIITIFEDDYPENLKLIDDAPFVLYYKGRIKKSDSNAVAIVGTRKLSSYGKEVTTRFATELVGYGVAVVSGLAFGIDAAAHRAALSADGRCIAVLASGVDKITPRSNERLGMEIIKSGGAIVSEYPPGTDPLKAFFPYRNRIISGLSKAVIVVEGKQKSGTLHTARHASEQGREVFAVPGSITSPLSEAPHFLIKNGASIAFDTKAVLDELDMQLKVDKEKVEKIMPSDEVEEKLVKILENEPLHLDEIVRKSKMKTQDVTSKLTMMEIKGLVKSVGGGEYKKN